MLLYVCVLQCTVRTCNPQCTESCKVFYIIFPFCVLCLFLLLCLLQSDRDPGVLTVEAPGGYPFKLVGRDKDGKGAWMRITWVGGTVMCVVEPQATV